jgi:hypothetical protein
VRTRAPPTQPHRVFVVSPGLHLACRSLSPGFHPLNPHAPPLRSGGASSSKPPSCDLSDWLHYNSPSSCTSLESDGSPAMRGRGERKSLGGHPQGA